MIDYLIVVGIALVLCVPIALIEMFYMESDGQFTALVYVNTVLVSIFLFKKVRR